MQEVLVPQLPSGVPASLLATVLPSLPDLVDDALQKLLHSRRVSKVDRKHHLIDLVVMRVALSQQLALLEEALHPPLARDLQEERR